MAEKKIHVTLLLVCSSIHFASLNQSYYNTIDYYCDECQILECATGRFIKGWIDCSTSCEDVYFDPTCVMPVSYYLMCPSLCMPFTEITATIAIIIITLRPLHMYFFS